MNTSKRVLIVEDDPLVIIWIENVLAHARYTVVAVVTSGEEAIRKAAELTPDIVLMDIILSGNLDGIDAAECIRAQADIPIVYLTANTDEEMAQRAQHSEPFGYLCKPLHANELTLAIEMSLYRHKMETELKSANLHLQHEIDVRTKAEQELQRYREHLEELVEERTFELAIANDQLQQEIAVRTRYEKALQESEEQFRRLFECSIDAILIADNTGNYLQANDAACTLLGYSREQLFEMKVGDLTTTNLPDATERYAQYVRTGREVGEFDFLRADGERRIAEYSAVRLADNMHTSTLRDITDRKQAEEALKASETRYRSLFEEAAISLWEEDLSGVKDYIDDLRTTGISDMRAYFQQHPEAVLACAARVKILDVNKATLSLYGAASREELFSRFEDIFCENSVEGLMEGFCAIAESRKWSRHEALNRRITGERLNLIVRWTAVPGYEETYERVLVSVFDITDRKRAEESLRIANETALDAQRAAESANRTKSEFLANMSHELRTPLNSVLGYTQILQRDSSLSEQHRMKLTHIERNGQHLLLLINDLLDLARIETGRIELAPHTIHVPAFLLHIADTIEFRARAKGVALTREFAPDLPQTVYADEVRLRQILLNLLGNAVKFTDRGGTVTFTVKNVDEFHEFNEFGESPTHQLTNSPIQTLTNSKTQKLLFEISDMGSGISEDLLEKIFEPFTHITDSQHRADGVGLGLSISQRLAQMMNTRIHVRSTIGRGSIFWVEVTLPAVEKPLAGPKSPSRAIVGLTGQPRKILLVDDDAENLEVLYDMLAPLGFAIATAADGDEAVNTATTWQPDLILMDLRMPQLDGWEATRRIRDVPGLAQVKIVAVSASAHGITRQKALNAGCDAFFSKPFSMTLLLDTIGRLLKLEWRVQSGSQPPDSATTLDAASQAWIFPPTDELQALRTLINNGLVLEIGAWTDRLERLDARYTPFSSHLRQLNQEFAFDEMLDLLNQALEVPHDSRAS